MEVTEYGSKMEPPPSSDSDIRENVVYVSAVPISENTSAASPLHGYTGISYYNNDPSEQDNYGVGLYRFAWVDKRQDWVHDEVTALFEGASEAICRHCVRMALQFGYYTTT